MATSFFRKGSNMYVKDNYAGPSPPRRGGARGGDVPRRTRGGGFQPAGAGYVSSSTTVWQGSPQASMRGPQFWTPWARRSHHHALGGGEGVLFESSRASMSGKKSKPSGDVGRFGGATHSMGA